MKPKRQRVVLHEPDHSDSKENRRAAKIRNHFFEQDFPGEEIKRNK